MIVTLSDHYRASADRLHLALVPERSGDANHWYGMLPDHGSGYFRQVDCGAFTILIADFTPKEEMTNLTDLTGEIIEISYFDTASSRYRVVRQGILCHVNRSHEAYATCEAGKPTRFVKILLTQAYLDDFLRGRYGDDWRQTADRAALLSSNPTLPELVFIFRQIRSTRAMGVSLRVYLEGKVLEVLSLLAQTYEDRSQQNPPSIRLTRSDRRWLAKSVAEMKRDLAAYPSVEKLASTANMSLSRFQLAFKRVHGTTPYAYLQDLRMNCALGLLHNPDLSIGEIAAKVGYATPDTFRACSNSPTGFPPVNTGNATPADPPPAGQHLQELCHCPVASFQPTASFRPWTKFR